MSDDVDKIHITSNKIEKKFDRISKVEMSDIEEQDKIEGALANN